VSLYKGLCLPAERAGHLGGSMFAPCRRLPPRKE
jgi:hypothetical protein